MRTRDDTRRLGFAVFRHVVRAVLVLGLIGVLALGSVWMLQRSFIYHPGEAEVPPAGEVIEGARDITLTTSDGLELTAWFLPPVEKAPHADTAVLMAPGNAGDRRSRAGLAGEVNAHGFAVLVLEYRGFGGNPGRPSEDGLAADALAASDALTELGYPPERTLYFGESLGTGVVAGLQAARPPAGIVLRSPFTDLADLGSVHYPEPVVRLVLRDRFPVREQMAGSQVPTTVIHGDRDSVVPSAQSAAVAAASPVLVEELLIEGADHNDEVMFGSEVADAMARLSLT
ncbi:MAG: alpha/beta hydrolase [Propionibacteriaceae bacterium]